MKPLPVAGLLLLVSSASVPFVAVKLAHAQSARQTITYAKDIAPLIAERCGMCHHPGGSAPFSLLSYGDVKRRAALIASVTERRYMPPWKANPSNGPFVGQHPLSDSEIALIRGWVDSGAVEGEPRDLPP